MGTTGLQALVKRIFADSEFKRRMVSNPEEAAREYHLGSEEKQAVAKVRSRLLLATGQGQTAATVETLGFWGG